MITQSQRSRVSVIQINLQHCKAASAALYKQIAGLDSVVHSADKNHGSMGVKY